MPFLPFTPPLQAFALWTSDWAELYDEGAPARKVLQGVHDTCVWGGGPHVCLMWEYFLRYIVYVRLRAKCCRGCATRAWAALVWAYSLKRARVPPWMKNFWMFLSFVCLLRADVLFP